ncbi:myo-inositol-1(or 4)-monophosphatase [Flavobacteriales bacterium]|nr:Inositol-1-monophosphatase [Flavobacteriales bacterium]WKZ76498.1 MAG: inositol monophosphatase family protein [Vicingaceae bacterium]GIK69537.1 MAG: inositol monophosphatase [Bacteroidota bacterium]CAG0957480.1 myo-inositol-1(or 4)-monophosphatase [Flavobacteriales bacterium]
MNYEEMCKKVVEIAQRAGNFISSQRVIASDIEEKSKNSLVTFVDKQTEKIIVDALSNLLPEAGFITEEGTSDKKGKKFSWIIDPLDGTTNFIHGVPCYAVSIALTENEDIVLGVVYEINLKECFYAWKNSKAYLNGKEIAVSNTSQLKNALIATGFPYYNFSKLNEYLDLFRNLLQETRGIRRPGAASVDLAYVACGRFDGFYEITLHPWDVAAGAFIIQQAGGFVSDFSGNNNWLYGEEIVVGNKTIHQELLDKIKNHFLSI